MSGGWGRLQETYKVQQQFLEKRLKTLNKGAEKYAEALQEKVEALYKTATSRDCPDWVDVYTKIGDKLRKSDLTINLKSTSWFAKDNTYKRYTQTYQRNTDKQTGKTQLKDDSLNPAVIRGTVDDRVTLPEDWRRASKFSQKRRLYDAMSFSGSALPEADDAPMREDAKLYVRYLDLPKNDGHTKLTLQEGSADTTNRHFNADAKQIFAAINYGRRTHGSSIQYGASYLILNPELKAKCLYFPGDTFYFKPAAKGKDGKTQLLTSVADAQVTYEWLGHILLWAAGSLAEQIFQSCYEGVVLGNSSSPSDLVEAHLFSDIRVDRDAQTLVLAREDGTSGELWETIRTNAYEWGRRNHVRVLLNDG